MRNLLLLLASMVYTYVLLGPSSAPSYRKGVCTLLFVTRMDSIYTPKQEAFMSNLDFSVNYWDFFFCLLNGVEISITLWCLPPLLILRFVYI